MLQRSMCTGDGLVDGAMGTVTGYDFPEEQRTAGQHTCGISVVFDNTRVCTLHAHLSICPLLSALPLPDLMVRTAGPNVSDINTHWSWLVHLISTKGKA